MSPLGHSETTQFVNVEEATGALVVASLRFVTRVLAKNAVIGAMKFQVLLICFEAPFYARQSDNVMGIIESKYQRLANNPPRSAHFRCTSTSH